MNNMKKGINPYWVYYQSAKYTKIDNCGKWMHFFNKVDYQYVLDICEKAIKEEIVDSCKHTSFEIGSLVNPNSTKGNTGVICFYLDGKLTDSHKKVLGFMIENNLIQKTNSRKLYNIGFKFDEQTLNNEYGDEFTPLLKLEEFVDLQTGLFL